MPIRTTEDLVRDIISTDIDIDVNPFIRAASVLVNKISSNDYTGLLDANDLKEIETWLAAHLYAHRDQLLTSKSTSGASGSFQGQFGMLFESTQYGQTAMLLDITMYLAKLQQQIKDGGKKTLGMVWIGSTEQEYESYTSIYREMWS